MQKIAIWAPSHNFIGLNKACIDNWKKLVKQQYLLHMSPQYGWDRFRSLGHPSKIQRVSHFGFITAATWFTGGQPNFARCLAVSCAATLCIHFWGLLPCDGISPRAILTLRPSLAFSCIGSITARHPAGSTKLCGVVKRMELRNFHTGCHYIWLGGHHVGHRPTF